MPAINRAEFLGADLLRVSASWPRPMETVPAALLRYAVFFNMKAWAKNGKNNVLLVIQSAYKLEEGKPLPGRGKIGFYVLLGHTLRGTKPKRP